MSKELIERLRELSAKRKPYATGAHGQMIGMESYRIVANGFALECIDEAADRIEELEREVERKMSAADFILRERDALQADNARLREALERSVLYVPDLATVPGIAAALAATPEQSLARIRNQVREECALVIEECALEADRQSEDEPYGHAKFRCANIALELRAMKEPE